MNSYITDPKAWAAKCVDDPRWLAVKLKRIARFGGDYEGNNVLRHSLEVAWRLRGSSPVCQLWALFHDAHENQTGDIRHEFKHESLAVAQLHIDTILRRHLGIHWHEDLSEVTKMDRICGRIEFEAGEEMRWQYTEAACVDTFDIKARRLMAVIAATKRTP